MSKPKIPTEEEKEIIDLRVRGRTIREIISQTNYNKNYIESVLVRHKIR